ncbi:GNAT family N-acetyltransferase [candidate division KSB1 bacterium]|nr:GNAT family N-acetyltransferase [candidate division KSB1 bacterium]
MSSPVKLRPITPEDEDFLYRVYAGTREDIAQLNWDQKQQEKFLKLQFMAQHKQYKAQFCDADFQIILEDERPVGRFYVNRTEGEIRIVDIALLPEFRGKGMGSTLLKQVLAEGTQKRLPVRIHVQQSNPAFHLYQRLGFQKIDENGIYYLMEWTSN